MKTVRKFNSFEELKASEKGAENYELSLMKHEKFQEVLKQIYSISVQQKKNNESK
ncbi:hypothetical protein GCM10007390_00310 [Persicitalea jodogahamensis]|uniref:Uncharacterized protein n=1 Tax=Persicitalea jodogahamensis TaxID=402147 RepID=A0A8J3G7I5_9BACT|nr:hypothetical protein GCM10007390_00310 [Persicitalea jodogahamensis]